MVGGRFVGRRRDRREGSWICLMMDYNNLTLAQATAIQEGLKAQLRFDLLKDQPLTTIGGADISFNKGSNQFFAAIVVLSFPNMTLQGYALARGSSDF